MLRPSMSVDAGAQSVKAASSRSSAMQQDAGRVSSKSEQRPQYEQLRGSSSNATTMENRPGVLVRVRRAFLLQCGDLMSWKSIFRSSFGPSTLLPTCQLASDTYTSISDVSFFFDDSQPLDSILDMTTLESSLSSNLPLVQLPLASSSCTPRVRALRLTQSFGRSSEEPLQVTYVCCLDQRLLTRPVDCCVMQIRIIACISYPLSLLAIS